MYYRFNGRTIKHRQVGQMVGLTRVEHDKKSQRRRECPANASCISRSNGRASRAVAVHRAIFSSPATYSHLRSRLHHRGGKVLLLGAQVRPGFSFLFRVRSFVGRSVGRSGLSVGSPVVVSDLFVRGHLTSRGLSLSALAASPG